MSALLIARRMARDRIVLDGTERLFPSPDCPGQASAGELGFPRPSGLVEVADDDGGGLAAHGQGPERGRVPGAVRHRGGLPAGLVRDALARGPDLPRLR